MKNKIYIAGKVTGLEPEDVIKKFKYAQVILEELGFEVVNPIEVVNDFNATWNQAMRLCIASLMKCDGMIILPCWQDSPGAKIEIEIANALDIVVCNYNEFGLKVLKKNLWNK